MIGMLQLFQLPQASTFAKDVDALYDFIFWVSIVSFAIIVIGMVVFVIRYHRRRKHPEETPYIEGHTPMELSWAAVLFVVVMIIFAWGWVDYVKMRHAPADALEINIIGRQWLWEIEYANGRKLTNELVVPKDKPVKLIMSAADVLHSFFVPSFRIKQDLVPGAYTSLWFNANQTGEFQIYCAEYCGTGHSAMLAKVKVLEPAEYERWQSKWEIEQQLGIASAEAATPAHEGSLSPLDRGKKLFAEKGCTACHAPTREKLVGPGLSGLFGHEMELADGTKVTADENYLRESLMDPQLKLVKGFPPLMPTYRGQLTDEEVNALVAFIKSLKE